ncbi:Katanin p80 WD40 repeat-containing subunit B1 [Phlyctochytrium planicorne]|nr:Katanin p80 WD40 repeat-containing subunit B1 [Phlyctochytrium planicorne]
MREVGSKIHDFVAHSSAVTCLKISPKSGRILITGGEDRKVNLWAIGKTTAILFNRERHVGLAGRDCGGGFIKWFDKVMGFGTFKSVEFHPFGEFFASGSADAVVKIWDVRKKGCIQTYSGHEDSVTRLRITPDGRWIATGSQDGTVKIWDMTAGKILKTFSEPKTKLVALEFNPSEFLMATIASDSKIRFYDLQSFEMVSESPPLPSVPSALEFHPDGHEVIVACRDSLHIWTWEPAKCHDSAVVNWSNISDVCGLQDGKLMGAAINQNFVSVWGVDLSGLKPYKVDIDDHIIESQASIATKPESIIEDVRKDVASMDLRATISDKKESSVSKPPETPSFDPVRSAMAPQDHSLNQSNSHSRQNTPTDRPASRQIRQTKSSASLKEEKPDSTPKKSQFILGSSGDRPLNLDISNFIQEPRKKGISLPLSPTESGLPHPSNDAEVIESLEFRHISMVSIFSNRLSSIRSVRQAWDGSDLKSAMDTLAACRDPAVWVDILRVLNLKPKLLNLETATVLLPLLNELLFEVYEDYIITACTTVRILSKSFGQVVIGAMTSATMISPGLDFAREERLHRCRVCYQKFQDINLTLQELKRAPGRVGMAVRETLAELQAFE